MVEPAPLQGLTPTRRTRTFDQETVPKGLLADHATRAGVWGRINVESGSLIYCVVEPGSESETRLDVANPGIILPEQKHHVRVNGPVEFHVQFYERSGE